MAEKDYLTPKEAADYFGVKSHTIARWEKQGKLKCFRTLGGHRRYLAADVRQLKNNQQQGE